MNILCFGKTGQVARELRAAYPGLIALGRPEADLSDPAQCYDAILSRRPDAIINAAAWTAVDAAEDNETDATTINASAPAAMARAAHELAIPFVHISTDYVFNGTGESPFTPEMPCAPLSAYGRSKCAGEEAVRTACPNHHVILRTSWVFSKHGANFVKTMLRLREKFDNLSVVADQTGGPTPARAIAAACLHIAQNFQPAQAGTYHFSGTPNVSWAEFAREIFRQSGNAVTVQDIATSEYPTPAHRPENSRLNCDRTHDVFALERPDWKGALAEILASTETENETT